MVLIWKIRKAGLMKWFICILLLCTFNSFGQIPPGYYDSASGLTGQQLRAALQSIIDDHQEQSYSSVWTYFKTTDDRADGKVWDMYSDIPGGNPAYTYTFVFDQCGSYSAEGDCYNREHSFPKSWFNDGTPMLTDLFHLYPTDGYVNGMRNNYPYGEVGTTTWTSTNGSKVGNCSYTGYTGVVFEPIDEYKGDFARTYFYMLTRYMSLVSSWNCDMISGNDFQGWAKSMLLEWDENDPVSQKEIDRNNTVFQIQDNRNPFIDHPEYAGLIWGSQALVNEPVKSDIRAWYANDAIHIQFDFKAEGRAEILNIVGQPLKSWQIRDNNIEEKLDLKDGIYILVIQHNTDRTVYKFLVSR
jgi:endonuclease I